jgi:hypothetical protein
MGLERGRSLQDLLATEIVPPGRVRPGPPAHFGGGLIASSCAIILTLRKFPIRSAKPQSEPRP